MESIGFYDKNECKKYLIKVKRIKNFVKYIAVSMNISAVILCLLICIIFFDYITVIEFYLLNSFITIIFVYRGFGAFVHSFLYFFIVCYFSKLRLKLLNNQILNNRIFKNKRLIQNVINEQNYILNEIISYNKFWKKYFFSINYGIIPLNLMLL